jgi:hypothetical protein
MRCCRCCDCSKPEDEGKMRVWKADERKRKMSVVDVERFARLEGPDWPGRTKGQDERRTRRMERKKKKRAKRLVRREGKHLDLRRCWSRIGRVASLLHLS